MRRFLHACLWMGLVFTQLSTLNSQPAPTNRVLSLDTIRGKLQRFDQTPHVAVPVQLLDRSNQVVQTQLSDEAGGYSFTNVPPGTYRVRCQVLGGFRYHGLDRILPGTLTNAGPEAAAVPALTLQGGSPIENADFTFASFKKGTWTTYNFRNGLAGNEVRKILPLDDGTVWIATMSGVSIFDGATFKHLRKEDGLPDNRIFNLHREPSGTIWICTGDGVARFDPAAPTGQQLRSYTSADGLIPGPIHAVCRTPDGAMWFGRMGLSKFDGKKFVTFPMTNLLSPAILKMTATKDGTLWIGTRAGLVRFDGTNFNAVAEPRNNFVCDNPTVGPDGAIWVASSFGQGLWRYDPLADSSSRSQFRNYTSRDGLVGDEVFAPHFTRDGTLWIGTSRGVSRFDGTNFVNFTPADGFVGSVIIAINSTSDGVLWFAARDGGLTRYDPHSFESYTVADGLAANDARGAHRLPDGTLWFGSGVSSLRPSGLNRFIDGKFVEVPLPDGDTGDISRIRVLPDAVFLAGAFKRVGAYRIEGTRLVSAFTTSDPEFRISADVTAEKDGTIWLARSLAGLWRAQRQPGADQQWNLRGFGQADFPPGHPLVFPVCLELDDQGRLWVGAFSNGACRYENEHWQLFNAKDGLAGDQVRMIWKERDGSLWFATEGGASRFDGKTFYNFTRSQDRLASDSVLFIGRDSRGVLWFGTDSGVTRFDGQVWSSLDSRDGLTGDQVRHVLEDTDGAYWFSTDRGVTHYRPRRGDAPRPLVSMILDARPYAPGDKLPQIEQGRSVRFKLDVNDLRTRPETRRFRYQVVSERKSAGDFGNTNGWLLTGKASEIAWRADKHGVFTMAVQYIDRDLNYSPTAVSWLSVVLPWYRDAKIIGPTLLANLALLAGFVVSRRRLATKRREAEQLREQLLAEEHRAREAAEAAKVQVEAKNVRLEAEMQRRQQAEQSLSLVEQPQAERFHTSGTLRPDAPSYVERRADRELLAGLARGDFCYVLTSRQMGKSSLMVRTTKRLREHGRRVATLDLTAVGTNLTPDQWYLGLLSRVGSQLDLEDALEDFWFDHEPLGPVQRFFRAIREVALAKGAAVDGQQGTTEDGPRTTDQLVIFVDELDVVRSLPFRSDEFFAAIREQYNRRAEDAALNQLTFCLLGVATPGELIRDPRTTPFNIGQRIELEDFTREEVAPLARGLGRSVEVATELMDRIYYWTGGHPYLTQKLCRAVVSDPSVQNSSSLDELCHGLFLTPKAMETDDNLIFARERLLRTEEPLTETLGLYKRVLAGERVAANESSPLVAALRLAGLVREANGTLGVRNRIYETVFSQEWVKKTVSVSA